MLHKSFAEQGIDCRVGTRVDSVEVGESGVSLTLGNDEGSESLEVESLLLAIGVVPNLDGAVSAKLKLDTVKGYLKVEENYETT